MNLNFQGASAKYRELELRSEQPVMLAGIKQALLFVSATLPNIRFDSLLPLPLCFQNIFDGVAECTVSAGMWGHEVDFVFHFLSGVGHSDR